MQLFSNRLVKILISWRIQPVPLPDLRISCKTLWVKLKYQKCWDLYLEAFYRPQVSNQFSVEQLNNLLSMLTSYTNNPIIWLSGDFNLLDIEWQTLIVPPGSNNLYCEQLLLDITQDHNLFRTVFHPTCLHNMLDLYFANFPSLIQNMLVIPGLSDNEIIMIEYRIKPLLLEQTNRKSHYMMKQTGNLLQMACNY